MADPEVERPGLFVPCWTLARAHALLLPKGYGGRMERSPGYLDVIRLATARPAKPRP